MVQRALRHQPGGRTWVADRTTRGLLAFRLGDAVQGEQLYLESVAQAHAEKDRANELLAQLYLARERSRVGQVSQGFEALLGEAEVATEPSVTLAARKEKRDSPAWRSLESPCDIPSCGGKSGHLQGL